MVAASFIPAQRGERPHRAYLLPDPKDGNGRRRDDEQYSAFDDLLQRWNETFERPLRALANSRFWPASGHSPTVASDLRLLRHFERIVYFDAEIPAGVFKFCMPEQ
jgi:hypothetical protein